MFPSPLSALDCQPWPRICGRRRAAEHLVGVRVGGRDEARDGDRVRATVKVRARVKVRAGARFLF